MYVCMSVCMYLCMYVCMYVGLNQYVCMYVSMYVRAHVCMYLCWNLRMKLGIAESFMCTPAGHQAEVGGFPRLRLCLFIFKHSSADATDFHIFSSS